MRLLLLTLFLILLFGKQTTAQNINYRPDLFFREDWKEIPAEIPLSQKHVDNPDLILHLYGPGKDSLKKSNHPQPIDDPFYVWSGLCLGNWLVTLQNKQKMSIFQATQK